VAVVLAEVDVIPVLLAGQHRQAHLVRVTMEELRLTKLEAAAAAHLRQVVMQLMAPAALAVMVVLELLQAYPVLQ
jgi:hypothetical protein